MNKHYKAIKELRDNNKLPTLVIEDKDAGETIKGHINTLINKYFKVYPEWLKTIKEQKEEAEAEAEAIKVQVLVPTVTSKTPPVIKIPQVIKIPSVPKPPKLDTINKRWRKLKENKCDGPDAALKCIERKVKDWRNEGNKAISRQ